MSDNLKTLQTKVETDIDPNGAPQSILAQNHQDILKDVLTKVGKRTGFHFVAQKQPAQITTGLFSWEGNAFNNIADFVIKISQLSSDLNDIGDVLALYSEGTLIHFKDYVGRSAFLTYKSHEQADDGFGNTVYEITVAGSANNTNYVYQDAESEPATISFHQTTSITTKVINFGTAQYSGGETQVAAAINALPDNSDDYKTAFPNELIFFTGIIFKTQQNNKPLQAIFVLKRQSPGIFGTNGDIVLSNSDLLEIEVEQSGGGGNNGNPPNVLDDPNANLEDLGEIANGDWLTVINSEPNPYFVIDNETNWYFELTIGGKTVILAHVGVDGTYGLGQDQMIATDLVVIYDERTTPDLELFSFACSDETSDLAVGTVYEMRIMDRMEDVQVVDFSVVEAPTGSGMIFDVQKNDVSIYSTKPVIDVNEFTTMEGVAQQVLTGTIDFDPGDKLTVIIDQVGSTTPGKNLKGRIKHY